MKGGQFKKSGAKKTKNVILPTLVDKCPRCGTIQNKHPRNCPYNPKNLAIQESDESQEV